MNPGRQPRAHSLEIENKREITQGEMTSEANSYHYCVKNLGMARRLVLTRMVKLVVIKMIPTKLMLKQLMDNRLMGLSH